jgi:hypothetical protein
MGLLEKYDMAIINPRIAIVERHRTTPRTIYKS